MHPNYRMARYKTHGTGMDGRRYSFTILRDGKTIGTGDEDGDGGSTRWTFSSPAERDAMVRSCAAHYGAARDEELTDMIRDRRLADPESDVAYLLRKKADDGISGYDQWGLDYWIEEQIEAVDVSRDNAKLRRRVATETLVVAIGGTAAYQAESRKGYRGFKGEPTPGNVQRITPKIAASGVIRFAFLTHALMDGEPLIHWLGMPGMARMEAIANGPAHPNLVVIA